MSRIFIIFIFFYEPTLATNISRPVTREEAFNHYHFKPFFGTTVLQIFPNLYANFCTRLHIVNQIQNVCLYKDMV